MNTGDLDTRVEAYMRAFEALDPTRLDDLAQFFTELSRFRDPFNDVTGWTHIRAVFEHMYRACPDPRFRIIEWARTDDTAFIRWQFTDGPPGRRLALDVDGVSRVRFDGEGRVLEHLDYWDPAAHLYERIPLLGVVLRAVRRRIARA